MCSTFFSRYERKVLVVAITSLTKVTMFAAILCRTRKVLPGKRNEAGKQGGWCQGGEDVIGHH